jgi:hypothetical protein
MPKDQDDDEFEDENEEEEEEEEEEEPVQAAPPPPPPAPAPAPRAPGPRKTRARTPAQVHAGVGASPNMNAPFRNTDPAQLWGEILDRLRAYPQLGTVYDLNIRIMNERAQPLGTFEASTVQGSEQQSPGDALVTYVIDQFHIPLAQGAATYDIQIVWKKNSNIYARARLNLPSREQLLALRLANERRTAAQAPPGFSPYPQQGYGAPPPGYGSPQGYAPQPQPHYAQPAPQQPLPAGYGPAPQQGYGAPPYAPQQAHGFGSNERELAMIHELAASRGMFADMAREMLQRAQAAPVGITQEEMRLRVENAELRARLGMAGQPAQPAQAVQPRQAEPVATGAGAPPAIVDPLRSTIEGMISTALQTAVQHVAKGLQRTVATGFGATPQEAEAAAAQSFQAEVMEPEPPEDHKPYHSVELGAKWGDGRPVVFTKHKESGAIDWGGAAFENPIIIETGMEIGKKLGDALGAAVQKMAGMPPPPRPESEVVRTIPRSAIDAGVGYAPPPQPPPPAPNGGVSRPWPKV